MASSTFECCQLHLYKMHRKAWLYKHESSVQAAVPAVNLDKLRLQNKDRLYKQQLAQI